MKKSKSLKGCKGHRKVYFSCCLVGVKLSRTSFEHEQKTGRDWIRLQRSCRGPQFIDDQLPIYRQRHRIQCCSDLSATNCLPASPRLLADWIQNHVKCKTFMPKYHPCPNIWLPVANLSLNSRLSVLSNRKHIAFLRRLVADQVQTSCTLVTDWSAIDNLHL